jgi:gamma-glutamyltranspeptidase/glutathione hydrolase
MRRASDRRSRAARRRLATVTHLGAALALLAALAACARAPVEPPKPPSVTTPPASAAATRAPVAAANGMVASGHPLASEAGLAMLRAGGNAVDAAVAAAFAIGVAEPNASGLGGEGMLLVYLAGAGTAVAIDYRSTAPAAATREGRAENGYRAVAVPGTVAGLSHALERYGTKALPDVLAPSIRIAENGFLISSTLAAILADNFEAILADPALSSLLCPEGLPLEAGALLRNPELAQTLRRLAEGGPDVFYRGEIAFRIAAAMAAGGGFMTADDLAGYRAIEREPVRGRYRGREILSAPPPVGGLALVETLQVLDQLDLRPHAPDSPERIHLTAEALKRAFADYSAYVADPAFVEAPLAFLLSPGYAKARAAGIRLDAITPRVEAGRPETPGESPSTTTLAVVDRHGNMVTLTQTLSDFFGAKVLVPGTGIILNNELKNFASRGINAMAPGKRMRTTIAPTVVLENGRPLAALGTPGAARIVSTTTLIVSNLLDYGMDIQQAIDAPRFFARDIEKPLHLEARVPQPTQQALRTLGYELQVYGEFDLFFGGAQGIVRDPATGRLLGGADPRRDGAVVGY